MPATTQIDLDTITAIDIHVHVETDEHDHHDMPEDFRQAAQKHFRTTRDPLGIDAMADYYRERNLAAVIFTVDHELTTGHPPISNRYIADKAAEHPDVFLPFASLDPARGSAAVDEARILVEEYGVRGFKFHPNLQSFFPNDHLAYPLYEAIQELGVVSLFHTGQSAIGSGMPGSGGIRLKYSNPIHLDDVAVDFPAMPIILAHPSFPWQDEALAVTSRHTNVYIDLSGWSPKYFPPQLVQHMNSLMPEKFLFGSDFPMITPDRWFRDFEQLDLREGVRPKVLKDNAIRLLKLND